MAYFYFEINEKLGEYTTLLRFLNRKGCDVLCKVYCHQ